MREHPTILEHVGIVPQRLFNAYPIGQPTMGWQEGDLIVHLAGCWVQNECQQRWEQYMGRRTVVSQSDKEQQKKKQQPSV